MRLPASILVKSTAPLSPTIQQESRNQTYNQGAKGFSPSNKIEPPKFGRKRFFYLQSLFSTFLSDNASTSNDFAANSNSVDKRNLNLNQTAGGKQQREGGSIMLQHFIQFRFILLTYLPFSCAFFLLPSTSSPLLLAQPPSHCHSSFCNQNCFRCCCYKSTSTASNAAADHVLSFIHPTGQSVRITLLVGQ